MYYSLCAEGASIIRLDRLRGAGAEAAGNLRNLRLVTARGGASALGAAAIELWSVGVIIRPYVRRSGAVKHHGVIIRDGKYTILDALRAQLFVACRRRALCALVGVVAAAARVQNILEETSTPCWLGAIKIALVSAMTIAKRNENRALFILI